MSYRLIDNETNEDIIDKLSRIKDERDKYEKILYKIKEWLKEQIFNKAGNSVDLAIENHSYCKVLDKLNELLEEIK